MLVAALACAAGLAVPTLAQRPVEDGPSALGPLRWGMTMEQARGALDRAGLRSWTAPNARLDFNDAGFLCVGTFVNGTMLGTIECSGSQKERRKLEETVESLKSELSERDPGTVARFSPIEKRRVGDMSFGSSYDATITLSPRTPLTPGRVFSAEWPKDWKLTEPVLDDAASFAQELHYEIKPEAGPETDRMLIAGPRSTARRRPKITIDFYPRPPESQKDGRNWNFNVMKDNIRRHRRYDGLTFHPMGGYPLGEMRLESSDADGKFWACWTFLIVNSGLFQISLEADKDKHALDEPVLRKFLMTFKPALPRDAVPAVDLEKELQPPP